VGVQRDAVAGVREQRRGERRVVRRVIEAAFGRPPVAELAEALQDSAAGKRGLSLVAESGRDVVGHVQLSRGWVDAERRLVEVQVLSPLAVAPGHQRQGVGTRLVEAALAGARRLGSPGVFLEGDPAYYRRFGFSAAAGHGFTAPSVRIPGPAFQVALLPGWQSWMTGALVYPEPFWALDCVGLRPDPPSGAAR
jgi:putative acetyltransferase